ncbi:MAG: hypothetical protein RMN51_12625 [Verrucomicrobiota bacterium]|nr:hypothetical protein [Limisphaera sp.]MDW8382938.1 hypothetical protein [Verrucomicrobiota bacterium]
MLKGFAPPEWPASAGLVFRLTLTLSGRAIVVLANGAECEPLLHKDAAVMERRAAEVVRGLLAVMEAVGAREGVIGGKAKHRASVEALQQAVWNSPARVHC